MERNMLMGVGRLRPGGGGSKHDDRNALGDNAQLLICRVMAPKLIRVHKNVPMWSLELFCTGFPWVELMLGDGPLLWMILLL